MLKDIGDRAFCAGLTRNVLCFYVHQPEVKAFPGYEWEAAGTHFDSHITWWNMSHGWLTYLSRCQLLLRQGKFVADFLYYYGEDVPNYVAARSRMTPPLPSGFDCDTINAETLLGRVSVNGGRLRLPDGMNYRYLVLPHRSGLAMSPAVCRKIAELVKGGATVIGPAPQRAPGLSNWPQCDAEVQALAAELWGQPAGVRGERHNGRGRVIWGRTLTEVVTADRLWPDIEFHDLRPAQITPRFDGVSVPLDWIHRRDGSTDIYFVANLSTNHVSTRAAFRVEGRRPELWDAVTGRISLFPVQASEPGCTIVPLEFEARQSLFVVFRKRASVLDKGAPRDLPPHRSLRNLPAPGRSRSTQLGAGRQASSSSSSKTGQGGPRRGFTTIPAPRATGSGSTFPLRRRGSSDPQVCLTWGWSITSPASGSMAATSAWSGQRRGGSRSGMPSSPVRTPWKSKW